MINVEAAIAILKENEVNLRSKKITVRTALGHVLAEDVLSPIDMPSFDQSAMDGYAFNFQAEIASYQVIDEVAAGSSNNPKLKIGEGVRIFTGAMVPDDANIVVQQEWIKREDNLATITESVQIGRNIRLKGEQIKAGSIALEKGTEMTPAGIGFLTGLGIVEINVIATPKISLITTGNELVKAGNELKAGQIYESNSAMLATALEQFDFHDFSVDTVSDIYELTKLTIQAAIHESDVVILTGGISVGDYDFVGKALQELEVEQLFYKINQKPGKPIYVGKKGNTLIVALPGNPAAALTCFYIYVLPALQQMMGKGFNGLEKVNLPMGEAYTKKGTRAEFLKAKIEDGQLFVLGMQSSAMLRSFAKADALVYIPATTASVAKSDLVTTYKLI
ncbi:MAG: molybdopterin molybdenumtransferase MoeA [Crocinitomix sp.]|nr:molybdopterin molybdenumtransferase MoeA [Crocinitomix sp.]